MQQPDYSRMRDDFWFNACLINYGRPRNNAVCYFFMQQHLNQCFMVSLKNGKFSTLNWTVSFLPLSLLPFFRTDELLAELETW